ncbi:MAG: LuxR C-terminal-related transcriptional regulator, partial [Anaerolineae bacterium]|nr:LuxR C-terminal-related transcriptional regulator [Anaerolineae bacterium]
HDILSTHASPMLVVVNITLAIANLVAGNWKKAQAALSAAEAGGASGPFWYLTLAYLNELRGSLHDALHAYHQMLKYLDETNLMVNVSLNYIGRLYYEANDLTTAETYLKEALHFGRKNKISRILVEGNVFLSQVYSAQGKWQEAENTIQDAIDITESYMPYPVGDFARTQQATLWLRQGKLKAAAHWLEHCRLVVGKAPIVFAELEYLVRAGVLLALRKPDEALTLLESLIPTLETAGRLTTLMRIRALQALAYVQYGDLNTALLYMRESLKIARSGYIRFFIEEGVPMESLLRECVRRGIEADYAAHVLTFFSGQPPVQQKLIDPLTERELEVLSLLEERLSNQEIAQKLVISPTTVKKHTGNIYSKLDVRSRREAVTRARQLGLMK